MNIVILLGFFIIEVHSRQCGPLPNDIYITKGEKRELDFWTTGEQIGETIVETHLEAATSELPTEPTSVDQTTEAAENEHPVTNTPEPVTTVKAEDLPQLTTEKVLPTQAAQSLFDEKPAVAVKPSGPIHIHAVEESFVETVPEGIQKKKQESSNVQIVAAVVAKETTAPPEVTSTAEVITTSKVLPNTHESVPGGSVTPSEIDTGDASVSSAETTSTTVAEIETQNEVTGASTTTADKNDMEPNIPTTTMADEKSPEPTTTGSADVIISEPTVGFSTSSTAIPNPSVLTETTTIVGTTQGIPETTSVVDNTTISSQTENKTTTASIKVSETSPVPSDTDVKIGQKINFIEELESADDKNQANVMLHNVKIVTNFQTKVDDVKKDELKPDEPSGKVPVTGAVDKGDSDMPETGVQTNPFVGIKVSDSDYHKSQLEKVIDVITTANAQEILNTHETTQSVVGLTHQLDLHKIADLSQATTVAAGQLLHDFKIVHKIPQNNAISPDELTTVSELQEAGEGTDQTISVVESTEHHFVHEKTDKTHQDRIVALIPQDRHPLFQSTVATDVRVHTEVSVVPIVLFNTTSDPLETTVHELVEKEVDVVDEEPVTSVETSSEKTTQGFTHRIDTELTTSSDMEHISAEVPAEASTMPEPQAETDPPVIGIPASGNMLVVDEELSEVIGNNGTDIYQNDYEVIPEMVTEPEEEHMVELTEMLPFPVVDVEDIVEEVTTVESETEQYIYDNPLNFVKPSRFDYDIETTESEDFPVTDANLQKISDEGSGDQLFEDNLRNVPVDGDFNNMGDFILLPHPHESRVVFGNAVNEPQVIMKSSDEEKTEQTTETEEIADLEASPADFRDQDQLAMQINREISQVTESAPPRTDDEQVREEVIKHMEEEKVIDIKAEVNQFPDAFTTNSLDQRLPIVVSEAPWERRPQDSPFPSVLQSLFNFLGGNRRQDTFREPIKASVVPVTKSQRKDTSTELSERVLEIEPEENQPRSNLEKAETHPVSTTARTSSPTTDPRILAVDGPSAIIRPHSNLGLNSEELRRLKLGVSSKIKATVTLDGGNKENARFNRGDAQDEGKREQFRRFLESQPMPLRNALLRGLPGERNGRSFFKEDPIECDWKIRTDPGLYILVTFRNISAPYSVDCHGAYIEVERDSNGYEARWCGERVMTKTGKPHVIFARRELRITVFDSGADGRKLKRPTGFSAEVEVVDLFDAVQFMDFKRSGSYSSVRRLNG